MDRHEWEDGSDCRLVRADGSEWRVTELRGGEHGLRVDAVRRDGPSGGSTIHQQGSDGRSRGRLEDELLGRGDRLHWLTEEGRVVWSMKLPMDQARSA